MIKVKLPKVDKVSGVSGKVFLGSGVLINLHNECELLKAFPILVDLIHENPDKFKKLNLRKVKIEMEELCDGLIRLEEVEND